MSETERNTQRERDLAGTLAAIEALTETLEAVRAELEAGALLDLTPLEAEIDALCRCAGEFGAAEAKTLRPALESLLGVFESLIAGLESRCAALQRALEPQAPGPAAAAAYRRTQDPA